MQYTKQIPILITVTLCSVTLSLCVLFVVDITREVGSIRRMIHEEMFDFKRFSDDIWTDILDLGRDSRHKRSPELKKDLKNFFFSDPPAEPKGAGPAISTYAGFGQALSFIFSTPTPNSTAETSTKIPAISSLLSNSLPTSQPSAAPATKRTKREKSRNFNGARRKDFVKRSGGQGSSNHLFGGDDRLTTQEDYDNEYDEDVRQWERQIQEATAGGRRAGVHRVHSVGYQGEVGGAPSQIPQRPPRSSNSIYDNHANNNVDPYGQPPPTDSVYPNAIQPTAPVTRRIRIHRPAPLNKNNNNYGNTRQPPPPYHHQQNQQQQYNNNNNNQHHPSPDPYYAAAATTTTPRIDTYYYYSTTPKSPPPKKYCNCVCKPITCPHGPLGHPGYPGKPGPDGYPGPDGQDGKDSANVVPHVPVQSCRVCPAGSPGIRGYPGKKGSDGKSGPDGPHGGFGKNGRCGLPGLLGNKGKDGKSGYSGGKGSKGSPGIKVTLTHGPKGPPGYIGEKGDHGLVGLPGLTGLQGDVGHTGPHGPKGYVGLRGGVGKLGPPGQNGPDGFYCPCPKRDGYDRVHTPDGYNLNAKKTKKF